MHSTPADARDRARWMPPLMSACVVVVVAMVAAINLALPKLSASELHPSSAALLWIVDAYILVFGCMLIPAGALGDRVGRKGVLLSGLGVFAVGCAVSAVAPGVAVLLVGRVVMGFGAALVMPATLSLLLQVTAPERKPQAIAVWTGATGAAGALGNLGGGLILQWLPWQGLFLVVAPIALILAALVAYVAPPGQRHATALDLAGAAMLAGTVLAVLTAIIEGPTSGWTSPLVLGSLVAGLAVFTAFVARSLRVVDPLLDPRMFAIPRLRSGTLGVGVVFFGLFALFFVNAQYLQYAKGYSPLVTGVAILPLPIGMIAVSRRSTAVVRRWGARTIVAVGMALVAAGLTALSFATSSTPYLPYAVALLAISTGMGLSVPSLSTGIMTSLPPERAGMGSGLNSASREIGAALGIAVIGTVMSAALARGLPAGLGSAGSTSEALRLAEDLGPEIRAEAVDAFTDAMAVGYRVVAAVVLAGTVLTAGRLASRAGPTVTTSVNPASDLLSDRSADR